MDLPCSSMWNKSIKINFFLTGDNLILLTCTVDLCINHLTTLRSWHLHRTILMHGRLIVLCQMPPNVSNGTFWGDKKGRQIIFRFDLGTRCSNPAATGPHKTPWIMESGLWSQNKVGSWKKGWRPQPWSSFLFWFFDDHVFSGGVKIGWISHMRWFWSPESGTHGHWGIMPPKLSLRFTQTS